tara:strand:+ start:1376 stop:2779 length:1404 start_codon:yes stop_codon:yes gene_type:complete
LHPSLGNARKKDLLIANNLRATISIQWPVVYLLYSPSSESRLSDEDFREIYFILTGAFPSEVMDNPDLIRLLSGLSETETTDVTVVSAYMRIEKIIQNKDNDVRAALLRPMFYRVNERDMWAFLARLSVKGGAVKRRDVISGLALANNERYHHVRSSVNLTGLKRTVALLQTGSFDYNAVRPRLGVPMIIPSPSFEKDPASVGFTKCYAEEIEGAWVTIHNTAAGVTFGFTSSGEEMPDEDNESSLRAWAEAVGLPVGIFLCDYAEMRDLQVMVIDWLTPSDPKMPYQKRLGYLSDHVASWALKSMTLLDDPLSSIEITGNKRPIVLRNARGIISYENTPDEIVLIKTEETPKIFRLTSGKVVQSQTGSPPFIMWSLSARDGLGYYPIGDMNADGQLVDKYIKRHITSSFKMIEGETVRIDVPCFVEVEVDTAGWGDYGPYIIGRIVKGSPSSGISNVVGVEELGWN